MSWLANAFNLGSSNTVTFRIAPQDRYHIKVKIRAKDGSMVPLTILADSGNDVTLLRNSTARRLGFDPPNEPGTNFPVGGITGGPQPFKKIVNMIQIGNLTPRQIHMGLAYKEESLAEDLLGRADILDSGTIEVDYGRDYVRFREKYSPLALSNGGGRMPSKVRAAFSHCNMCTAGGW